MIVANVSLLLHVMVRPYDKDLMNLTDTVNEICIFLTSYILLCFTEYVSDLQLKQDIGWAIVLLIALNVFWNISVFAI